MTNGNLQEQVASLSKSLEVENKQKESIQNQYEELARTKCEIEENAKRHSSEWEVCHDLVLCWNIRSFSMLFEERIQ